MSFLPGWFPGGAVGTKPLKSMTFISVTFGAASTVAAPSNIQAGDLLIFNNAASNKPFNVFTVPTGFTLLGADNDSSSDHQFNTSRKIADGTEGGTNIVGMDDGEGAALMVFRGDVAVLNVSAALSFQQDSQIGNPGGQTPDVSAGVLPFIELGWGLSFPDLTGVSMPNAAIDPSDELVTGYVIHNDTVGSGSEFNIGDGGTLNALYSYYINLS